MKFLAFVDVHQDHKNIKRLAARAAKQDIDGLICCGDISQFGRGLRENMEILNAVGKRVFFIPGNHEENLKGLPTLLQEFPNVVDLHGHAQEVGPYLFLGYGGNGFSPQDLQFRKIARGWYGLYQGRKIVLVTHGPPIGTTIDLLGEQHVGSIDYRAFIERIKPKVVVCGHLHETAGFVDSIGSTKVVNPGWKGMVVELK